LGAKFHPNFFAVYSDGFVLDVGLKDTLSTAQRKANVIAVLLAFAS
jgi:hypothetical protein